MSTSPHRGVTHPRAVPGLRLVRRAGNPTQSYRTRHALRIVAEVGDWQGHDPAMLASMLGHLAQLREQGLDVIDD